MKLYSLVILFIISYVINVSISFKSNSPSNFLIAYGGRHKSSSRSVGHMRSHSSSSRGGGGYVFIPDQPSMNGMSMNPKTLFLGLKVIILKVILLLTMKKGGGSDFLTTMFSSMDPSLIAAMMPGGMNNLG